MAHTIGGISVQIIIPKTLQMVKETAEKVVEQNIREALQNPAKSSREMHQPSPFSQFLDIKI